MANEVQVSGGIVASKGGMNISAKHSHVFTLTGNQMTDTVQVIGTGAELIVFPTDQTAEGVAYYALKNLDATNYVQLATDSGMTNLFGRMLPGGIVVIPPDDQAAAGSVVVYAKAHTGACKVRITAVGPT